MPLPRQAGIGFDALLNQNLFIMTEKRRNKAGHKGSGAARNEKNLHPGDRRPQEHRDDSGLGGSPERRNAGGSQGGFSESGSRGGV